MKPRINLTRLLTLSFLFSLLIYVSCRRENSQSGTAAQQEENASMASSESDGEAQMIFNGIFDDAVGPSDEVGMSGTGIFGRALIDNSNLGPDAGRPLACFTTTVTHLSAPAIFPIKIVLDFGTTGCVGADGHTRKGKIITEYTNRLIYPGAVATTTFDGFYIDSNKVEGTHKITNVSSTNTTPLSRVFTVDVINAKLTKTNGNYTEWNSHAEINQIEGLVTFDYPRDDVFRITGTSRGRVKRGPLLVGWESNTVEPLIKKFNCRWIVKGSIRTIRVNTTANSQWVALLDFGSLGDCDNLATITINGVTHQITLH